MADAIIKVGLIADPQYGDIDTIGVRFFRESVRKLIEALEVFRTNKVNFIINLGDLIDRNHTNYPAVLNLFDKTRIPYYNVLGNHDFEIEDKYKEGILERYRMPYYYYDFEVKNIRFIFLDGTELGKYSESIHPELVNEGKELRTRIAGKINDKPWNGGVGKRQQEWLKGKLAEGNTKGNKILIFNHFPVLPETIDLTLWNSDEIISIIEGFPNIVAYICGHYHEGGYTCRNGVHYITQKAMSDTTENAFAIMEIHHDKLKLNGFGNIENAVYRY